MTSFRGRPTTPDFSGMPTPKTSPLRPPDGTCVAILVSPGSIDHYPPVRNQAQLFVDEGYVVDVVTMPAMRGPFELQTQLPGVRIVNLPRLHMPVVRTVWHTATFLAALGWMRWRHRKAQVVEIAYDPYGMAFSDLAPGRVAVRIAHFHESVLTDSRHWIFTRLKRSVPGFDLVVSPDAMRARQIQDALGLQTTPTVVPNYPMPLAAPLPPRVATPGAPFEVIYAGSLGDDQKMDFICGSVVNWPEHTVFTIVGDLSSPRAEALRRKHPTPRLRFEPWLPFDRLIDRLRRADLGISLLDGSQFQWASALGASNKRYLYMQAGLPQIGDMNPGVPELLEGNGVGQSLKTYSPDELANIVAAYAADPARCEREGATAGHLCRTRFNYVDAMRPLFAWIRARLTTGVTVRAESVAPLS